MKTREEAKENGKIFFNETKRIVDLKGGAKPNAGKEERIAERMINYCFLECAMFLAR